MAMDVLLKTATYRHERRIKNIKTAQSIKDDAVLLLLCGFKENFFAICPVILI